MNNDSLRAKKISAFSCFPIDIHVLLWYSIAIENEIHSKSPARLKREIHGAIAQLGERLPCKQGVRSSILLGSTRSYRVGYADVCVVQLIT